MEEELSEELQTIESKDVSWYVLDQNFQELCEVCKECVIYMFEGETDLNAMKC